MIIGCLTGNNQRPLVEGTYSFCAPGLIDPLAPDLQADRAPGPRPRGAPGGGPFAFGHGVLTAGVLGAGVGWRADTVGETGVDVVFRLDVCCFVDHVVLHVPASGPPASGPAAPVAPDGIEAAGHVEPDGLSRVEVYAAARREGALGLVGWAGQRGPDVLQGRISIGVGVEAQELVVRLISYHRDIRLSGIELWGAGPGEPAVFPLPARMERLPGAPLVLAAGAAIRIGALACEDVRFAAEMLAQEVGERWGRTLPVVQEEGLDGLHLAPSGASVSLPSTGLPVPERPESYTLRVDAHGAHLLAADRRGYVYGLHTLLQLFAPGAPPAGAPAPGVPAGHPAPAAAPCLIEDAPRLPFRGAHLFLPARDQIDYSKRLIRYLLVPMRLNTLFLELAGGMRFERRPEISEAWARNNRLAAEGKAPPVPHGEVAGGGWLTQAEVVDLVEYARRYGIEVIPEIQSLSHVQYLTMTYPHIAEQPLESGYPDSYCPLHPESRQIVFDMIDEVVDLLGPLRYMHMGHDEVYTMAECPRCKGKPRDELYALDVRAIHDYLAAKGIGMMIWADMLQPWQRYAGQNAIMMIPNDIVLLNFVWYFRPWADTEDLLLQNGFQVIFGNCYSSHFTRYERRTNKEGVIGTEVSVWAGTNEEDMGRLGKLYDMIYSANTAWSAHCQDELRWTFDRRIADLLPGIRARLRGQPVPRPADARAWVPVDLGAHATAGRRDPSGSRGGYDLSALPRGKVTLRDRPFQLGEGVVLVESGRARGGACPEEVAVPIEARAVALAFAQTCTAMGPIARSIGARQPIARYEVCYADGTVETVEVAYGYHLAEWNRRHGAPLGSRFHRHAGYVATYPVDPLWQGKTARGEDVTLYGMEWANPHPGKTIQSVRIRALDAGANASLIVAGIALLPAADGEGCVSILG